MKTKGELDGNLLTTAQRFRLEKRLISPQKTARCLKQGDKCLKFQLVNDEMFSDQDDTRHEWRF